MRPLAIGIGIIWLLVFASGCALVRTDAEWAQMRKRVADRTGKDLLWERSEKEKAVINERIDRLLAAGLTRDDAVQIALFNNRDLQGIFEGIGISKSDLIQAGLLHNPSLSAFFRLPFHGKGLNVEIDALIPVSDLWQMPFRKNAASFRHEAMMKRIEQAVLETARDAAKAYDSLLYLSLSKKERTALFNKFSEMSHETSRRRAFGFSNRLEVYMSRVSKIEAQLELNQAETEYSTAKAHLDRIMGLKWGQKDYRIALSAKNDIPPIPTKESAIRLALGQRLDIQMARLKIHEAERKLKLEKWRFLRDLHVGASYEKEVEGEALFGPGVDLQLPLFDQNQAQIAKARFVLQKARRRLEALEVQLTEEIQQDIERIGMLKRKAQLIKDKIIPLRKKALEYAKQWVGSMQLNRLYLIEAQKGFIKSRLDYLTARMELSHAVADLVYHLGGKLPPPH